MLNFSYEYSIYKFIKSKYKQEKISAKIMNFRQ